MRFFKRAERPDSGPPGDEKVAAQMRSLAQHFVKITPREWSPPD